MSTDAVRDVCLDALGWARDRNYEGWDPYDGLNSPLLRPLSAHWLGRLLGMHGVHKFPVNLRPLLRVPKERNPKGIALFAAAYLDLYEATGTEQYLSEAESLLEWLTENRSQSFDLPCWGYNFDWQNGRKFFLPAYHPSIVVTVFCGRSFLAHSQLTGADESAEMAADVARFIETHINTQTVDGRTVYAYTPYDDFVLVNTNALAADYFYRIGKLVDEAAFIEQAEELFEFVVATQTDAGGWHYAVPPTESHLSYDNFHTGFVLESLETYASDEGPGHPAHEAYERGLAFYREHLFDDGAPRFEAEKRYPYDSHAAAQGILTFIGGGRETDREQAERIFEWTRRNLYDSDGYFYRRQGRVLSDSTPYMRWSQAWMCRALAALLRTRKASESAAPEAEVVV